ncbi:MAG: hypothetical protein Q7T80_15850, partial [Methanoregula sp.]|nr:hypothetical protein [Methanoregula sp.]
SPMSLSQSTRSPRARHVPFMVCLAIAGSCVAGAHYYTVDLPQQKATPPENNGIKLVEDCRICKSNCYSEPDIYPCHSECDMIC